MLFRLQPETVHYLLIRIIRFSFRIPMIPSLISLMYTKNDSRLEREFMGLRFNNPVGLAAGFDKNAEIYKEFSHFGFSFIEVGTVTPQPQYGNPRPRSFRLPKDKALINRMGFNNDGVDKAAQRLKKRKKNILVGGNIGKNTHTPNEQAMDDYTGAFEVLYDHVDYLVVNLSCPNIKNLNELQDPQHTRKILEELLRRRSARRKKKPIMLKISPDLDPQQLDDVIAIYYATGIDGIIATNTSIRRDGLVTNPDKVRAIGDGGLSGKPLTKRSTEVIRYLSKNSNGEIPVIGVGGIMSPEDALEKIAAGATLVQIYTGFIYNGPGFVKQINRAILEKYVGGSQAT